MTSRRPQPELLGLLERIVVGSVSVTARAVADAAPELSLLQWRVLVVLAGQPDGATVTEVAERIGSRLPATSRLLGRMRTRDLVTMRKDHPDARVTTVVLTPQGAALWERVAGRRRDDLAEATAAARLEADDRAVLDRLAAAFGVFQ